MIKTENKKINGIDFVRTYSTKKMKIHGGSPEFDYDEAWDFAESVGEYTETNIPIDTEE